jgi:uncharacterized membrane protein
LRRFAASRRRAEGAGHTPADGGTILMLTLGFLLVAVMLAIVVTDVSAVYLARRSVASAADGAALAAAQRLDEQAIYTGSATSKDQLPLADVLTTVADYQATADPSGATQLTASLPDPTTVEVQGSRVVTLPLVGFLGIGPVTVTAASDAQTRVLAPAAR